MKRLTLSSVLMFALVIPLIMTYRLSAGVTPYWLFGLIFLLMILNLLMDFVSWSFRKKVKTALIFLIIFLSFGGAATAVIIVRHQTAPVFTVHDIILQLEAAIQFILQGKNPYATSYFNTPLEQWHYSETQINPALFHFVMMPWYLLFSLPFYFLSISTIGFFDGRIPLFILFGFTLFLAHRLLEKRFQKKWLFLTLLTFNPATVGYLLEGRSDLFAFAFLFWSLFLLEKKRLPLAGIPLALAMATKQSIWPIFPFFGLYLWQKESRNLGKVIKDLLPFTTIFLAISLPFFLWDKKAFLDSTVLYLSGNVAHSYPISGYGWGMVLNQFGAIRDLNAPYSFWIWQVIVCIPLLFFLGKWLIKEATVSKLVLVYGLFTFSFWYLSRYFNNSHLGYLSTVFLTAYFWPQKRDFWPQKR